MVVLLKIETISMFSLVTTCAAPTVTPRAIFAYDGTNLSKLFFWKKSCKELPVGSSVNLFIANS